MLGGLSSIARSRREVQLYWVFIVWALWLLGAHVQMWWGYWDQSSVTDWTLPKFAATLVGPVLLYTLTRLLMPDQGAAGVDLREHFATLRAPFFIVLAVLWGYAIFWRSITFGEPLWITRRVPQFVLFGLAILGASKSSARWQASVVILSVAVWLALMGLFRLQLGVGIR